MALLNEARKRRDAGRHLPEALFVGLLLASGFLVRLWPVWQVHFWDETVYLQNAEVICCGKDTYSELSSRPPLLSILFAGAFRLWHHEYAASLLTAGFNALGPIFLYWAGRLLFGRAAAGISALLLAFSPFFVNAGNSLLTDSPALTLILASYWVLLEAVSAGNNAGLALAGFLTALAGLMRFTSLVVLAVFPLYWLRGSRPGRATAWFGLGLAAGLGPYLAWSRFEYGSFLATLAKARTNVAGSVEPFFYYFGASNLREIFTWVGVAGVALWFLAWLLDTRVQWRREGGKIVLELGRRETQPRLASDAILWWWVAIVLAYLSRIPHKELRYLLPLVTPWLLLAGGGLSVLLRGRSATARAAGAGILVFAMATSFAPSFERFRGPFIEPFVSEEKQVADYLDSVHAGGVLYSNFNYPVFAYYTQLPIRVLGEEDASFYRAFPGNMPHDGYLVLYKTLQKEPRPPWADSNPSFRRLKEFPSLIVYEYRAALRPSS